MCSLSLTRQAVGLVEAEVVGTVWGFFACLLNTKPMVLHSALRLMCGRALCIFWAASRT